MRLSLLLLAACFLAASFLAAPPARAQAENMSLIGQINPSGTPYSDVWHHVGPDGREYALLASWISGGLNVIDVTDPLPVLEGFVPMNGDGSDVEAYGDYAYLTSNSDPTLIIDISDPTNPAPVRTFGADFHTLSIVDGYLYGNGSSGVVMYDLADPEDPTYAGQYNPYYVHDVLVRNDTMYTAGIYGDGIDIVDVSDKSNPTMIARFNYPGSGVHNFCSDPSGSYLYAGDEIGSGRWTRIFDVRDPQNVEQVGEIVIDATSTVHNCHTKDGRLYIAHYNRGVWVFDITDPVNPVQVGYYDGPGQQSTWTANPQLPSGKVLASDIETGLLVLNLEGVVANESAPETPTGVTLTAAAPNPFADATTLGYRLEAAGPVRLAVYDLRGREVAVLVNESRPAGAQEVAFDAADLPNGVYLVRLDAAGQTLTQRVTLLR